MYTHRHTRHSHTGTEPRYSYTEVQPRHTEVYVTSKLCLNSQWPVSLVPPDELGGGKCFQTSSEHGGTDWLCVSDVFNFLLLQQLFWLPSSATYTFKGVAVTFLFELKIAEYPFKTVRRLHKEAKIHARGVLIIDCLFRSLRWNVPFTSSLCTFYLQHISACLGPVDKIEHVLGEQSQ